MGTETTAQAMTVLSPPVMDPKTMIDLTFTAHLQVPADLCPTFSLCKPGGIFSILETLFETLLHCLPGVGLTEINSFLVLLSLVSPQVTGPGPFGTPVPQLQKD